MIVNIIIKGILLLMIFFFCLCVGYFNVNIIKIYWEIFVRWGLYYLIMSEKF